jgi:hypothetical protein
VSSEELREQVGRISAGDFVVARFKPEGSTEYTVSGVVHAGWAGGLYIGRNYVLCRAGVPQSDLVAIKSHEPAKPAVPPEPTGDVVVKAWGQFWVRFADDRWLSLADKTEYTWREVVEAEQFTFGTLPQVYRPAPSPERIEELIHEYASTDKWQEVLVRFAADLLGGES